MVHLMSRKGNTVNSVLYELFHLSWNKILGALCFHCYAMYLEEIHLHIATDSFQTLALFYLDITLLYELLMGAVFYPTGLFISALLLCIMRKNIQNKPSERRKPDFWVWQMLNACSNQSLLQELQVLSTAEGKILSICWEVWFLLTYTSLLPVSCRHGRYFLEKCRTHFFFF